MLAEGATELEMVINIVETKRDECDAVAMRIKAFGTFA